MLSALVTALALTATPDLVFAFSNEKGDQLLALTPLAAPAELTKVSCDGKLLAIKHLAEQPEGPNNNGRQTARNFTQVGGSLFKIVSGNVSADALCLLGTEAAFAARKLFAVTPSDAPCDEKAAALAAKLGGKRKVTKCLVTGSFPGGRLLFAAYAPSGLNALVATLVALDSGAVGSRRFPAKLAKDAPSCWRVDDGCVFDPASYRVLFAMNGPAGWELVAAWGGAESQNAELLRLKASALAPAVTASRYWSPE